MSKRVTKETDKVIRINFHVDIAFDDQATAEEAREAISSAFLNLNMDEAIDEFIEEHIKIKEEE